MSIANPDKAATPSHPLLRSGARLACGLAISLSLSACIYVPVVDERDTASANCNTYTKSLTLNPVEINEDISVGCRTGDCAAVALGTVIVVTAGSAIISSSIVLTGNTLHWLEYQGTCSEGYLNKSKQLFLDSIRKLQPKDAESAKQK